MPTPASAASAASAASTPHEEPEEGGGGASEGGPGVEVELERELSPLAFTITTLLVFLIGLWLLTFMRCISALLAYRRAVSASWSGSRSLFSEFDPEDQRGPRDSSAAAAKGSTEGRRLSEDEAGAQLPAGQKSGCRQELLQAGQVELGDLDPDVARKEAERKETAAASKPAPLPATSLLGATSNERSHLVGDDDMD